MQGWLRQRSEEYERFGMHAQDGGAVRRGDPNPYGNRTGQASSGMSMIVGTVVTLMVMIMLALFAVVMLMGVLVLMLMRMTLRRAVRVRMRMLVRMFVSAFHRTLPG